MIKIEQILFKNMNQFREDIKNKVEYAIIINNILRDGFNETVQYERNPTRKDTDELESWFWDNVIDIFFAVEDSTQEIVAVLTFELRVSSMYIMHISGLAVKADYRRQGIGSLLFDSAIEFARSSWLKNVSIDVAVFNTPAQNLYKKKGMNIARYHMKKAL